MDYVYLLFLFICLLQCEVDLLLIRISWSETNVKTLNRPVRDLVQCGRQTMAFRINLLFQSSGKHIWFALKNYSLNSLPCFFFTISTRFTTLFLGLYYLFFVYHVPVLGAFAKLPEATVLFLSFGPRWLMPRMYCSHIGLFYYPETFQISPLVSFYEVLAARGGDVY